MSEISWGLARKRIVELFRFWTRSGQVEVLGAGEYRTIPDIDQISHGLAIRASGNSYFVQWKSSSSSSAITHAIHFLKSDREDRVPVVAVPYMGPTGAKLCEKAQVNWMDLSGNASIVVKKAPCLIVDITGQPNKFIKRGRPASVFAPKSSRIVRWMLLNPTKSFTNKRLVHETGADAGHISRILKHLLEEGYISRERSGENRLLNPELLLADWRASYDFFKQCDVIRGHMPARTSEELVQTLSNLLEFGPWPSSQFIGQNNILSSYTPHIPLNQLPAFAFSGLSAAWQYSQFVAFRLVTVYLKNTPSEQLLYTMQFRQEPRGANVWLAIPKDEGVFMGAETVNGIPCVSRLQTYLDLKDQPERADEAAEELKRTLGLEKTNG